MKPPSPNRSAHVARALLACTALAVWNPAPAEAGEPLPEPPTPVAVVQPKPYRGVLVNPGKGWSASGPAQRHPDEVLRVVGMGVRRFNWSQIEPAEGQFNWQPIEEFLDGWARLGKVCNIGVMGANSHSKDPFVTPKWVFDAGAAYRLFELKAVERRTAGVPGTKAVPVFDDPVFLEKLGAFLKALAAKYDGDPRIAVLDIRSYGNWGEGHMHPFGGPEIAPDQFRRHVQMHLDAFHKTTLCLSRNAHLGKTMPFDAVIRWAITEHHVAPRRDGICGNSDGRETALALGIAPAVFELFGDYDFLKERGWWSGAKDARGCGFALAECVENGAPTWVDLGRGGQPGLRLIRENRPLVERLTNRIGYHFLLQEAAYPKVLRRHDAANIVCTWLNQGVAPIYIPCHAAFALLRDDDTPAAVGWPGACRPAAWMPGKPVRETPRVLFADVPQGNYRLAVGLFGHRETRSPIIRIAAEPLRPDGWYVLGPVTVRP